MADLEIIIEKTPDTIIVKLLGDGSMQCVNELQTTLNGIAADEPTLVVLDMSQLNFITSLVMGSLVKFRGQIRQSGGIVKMAACKTQIAEAFKVANLSWIIPTFESVAQALED